MVIDHKKANGAGVLAILFWGTSFAVHRSLTEQLGILTAGACSCLLGGILGVLYFALIAGPAGGMRKFSLKRQAVRGLFLVSYEVCLMLAVGLSVGRQQVIEVGIINYLWPGLTLLLSVPILGYRAKPLLLPGLAVAMVGVVMASTQGAQFSWQALGEHLLSGGLPYVLALVAAVCWALYSNFSRLWAEPGDDSVVPFFVLTTGVVLGAMTLVLPEAHQWSMRTVIELLWMAVFPVLAATLLWNFAVQKGNVALLASLSHMTPLLTTVFSCIYLGVLPGASLWVACGLVIAGAVIARRSILSSHRGM